MTKSARFLSAGSCVLLLLLFSSASPARAQKPETAPCCRSTLVITAHRADLLVTAPDGFETGFNPLVSTGPVDGIPSSHYQNVFRNASGGVENTHKVKIEIDTPAAGSYLVQVFDGLSGKFNVKFTATDNRGATTSRKFAGDIWPGRTSVYIVRYSPLPGARFSVISLIPFSSFSAKLDISGIPVPPPFFRVSATLGLDSASPGFDPVTQPVSFRLDNYAVTIPSGSFIRNKQGNSNFDGTVDGITLKVRIVPEGRNKFAFKLEVQGTLSVVSNAVRLVLILGGNAGATRAYAPSP